MQPHQDMELHRLPIQTHTVQKGEGPRTCLKHRYVRWVLGDVPVMQPHQQFGGLVWDMELHSLPIQTLSDGSHCPKRGGAKDMPQVQMCHTGPG